MSMGGSRRVSGIVCFCTQGWDICRKKALDGRDVAGQSQQRKYWRRNCEAQPAGGSNEPFICGNMRNRRKTLASGSSFGISLLLVVFFFKLAITGFSFSLKTTKF